MVDCIHDAVSRRCQSCHPWDVQKLTTVSFREQFYDLLMGQSIDTEGKEEIKSFTTYHMHALTIAQARELRCNAEDTSRPNQSNLPWGVET